MAEYEDKVVKLPRIETCTSIEKSMNQIIHKLKDKPKDIKIQLKPDRVIIPNLAAANKRAREQIEGPGTSAGTIINNNGIDHNEEEWKEQKRKGALAKKIKTQESGNIDERMECQSSSEALNDTQDKGTVDNSLEEKKTNDPNATNKKIPKPPPINICDCTNREIATLLIGIKIEKSSFRILSADDSNHTIYLDTHQNYQKAMDLFKEKNKRTYTYTPKYLKHKSIILKGIMGDYSETERLEEIKSLVDTPISKIEKFHYDKEDKNLYHFLIQVPPEHDIKDLLKIKSLAYQRTNWQKVAKGCMMQCKKCQRLGHTASNCNLGYRCVKCTEDHKPGECKITQDTNREEMSCVNCKKKGHPASFRGCSYIVIAEQLLQNKKAETQANKKAKVTLISNKNSYAQVLKNANETVTSRPRTYGDQQVVRYQPGPAPTSNLIEEIRNTLRQTVREEVNGIRQEIKPIQVQAENNAKIAEKNIKMIVQLYNKLKINYEE